MSITKEQDKRVESSLVSILENLNDMNPKEKLNNDLVNEIKNHLEMIYITGVEDAFRMINKEYSKYQMNTVIPDVMVKNIINLHTYEL